MLSLSGVIIALGIDTTKVKSRAIFIQASEIEISNDSILDKYTELYNILVEVDSLNKAR